MVVMPRDGAIIFREGSANPKESSTIVGFFYFFFGGR
jgi:hypothetical protein